MGLRGMLDKYLPVEDIKQLLPYRTKVEAVKQMFDSDPTAWEKRPLTESQVRVVELRVNPCPVMVHVLSSAHVSRLVPETRFVQTCCACTRTWAAACRCQHPKWLHGVQSGCCSSTSTAVQAALNCQATRSLVQVLYAATDVAHMGRLAEFVYEALPEDVQAKVQKVSTERVLWYKESDEKALFDGSERAIAPLF